MPRTKKSTPTTPETPPASEAPAENTEQPVTLIGRLVADPVLRKTQNKVSVANFRIAVNHEDGEATFHNVVAWKRTAEVVAQYMKKGRLVEVRGHERTRTWKTEDGSERTSVEISAFKVQFLNHQRPAVGEVGA